MKTVHTLSLVVLFLLATFHHSLNAQVAINADGSAADPSAMLDVESDTAGMLVPRMTTSQRTDINNPAEGLLVYDTGSKSFWHYDGSEWVEIVSQGEVLSLDDLSDAISDNLSVMVGYGAGLNDNGSNRNTAIGFDALNRNTSGQYNTAIGGVALFNNATNHGSTAIGYQAMYNSNDLGYNQDTYNTAVGIFAFKGSTILSNNVGRWNTAIGARNLENNSVGSNNTSVGSHALFNNTIGTSNTAIGSEALYHNKANQSSTAIGYRAMQNADNRTLGRFTYNTAVGYEALLGSETASDNTGKWNTTIGYASLKNNSSGDFNTATGAFTLYTNTTGNYNAASGSNALATNTSGDKNTASGSEAMYSNQTGSNNTAVGHRALYSNTVRGSLVAIGDSSLYNNGTGATDDIDATCNTGVGSKTLLANTKGAHNTAVGYNTLKLNDIGLFNTAIGSEALLENTGGWSNTAVGSFSLLSNLTGNHNTVCGADALSSNETGDHNTVIGDLALWMNVSGENNTVLGSAAGATNTGSGNVFIGYEAGYSASGDNKLYIDNGINSIPLVYGDFSLRRVGIGSNSPDARLDIRSTGSTMDPLRVRVGSASKLRVHAANGSVSVGTSAEGPANGLVSQGNIEPNGNKGADLGATDTAWDDVYCDDLHNVAKSFANRTLTDEILEHPPIENTKGSNDNLDPNSLPEGLADKDALLTDEIASYNYKTNYEQQLMIEKLKKENIDLKMLLKNLEDRMAKLEGQ